jgi:hypothetical protein
MVRWLHPRFFFDWNHTPSAVLTRNIPFEAIDFESDLL